MPECKTEEQQTLLIWSKMNESAWVNGCRTVKVAVSVGKGK